MAKIRLGRVEKTILGLVTIHRGLTSREIADELQRDETQISDCLARLEDKGLITDTNCPRRIDPMTTGVNPLQGTKQ